ncbi:Fpg/Nei family DNA glycosylase [Xylanimonas allomyrinae]|uniref:DNA-(apurinic or apyrimidinic site) lyase n=1 Tax=Xylanimonas allomyrinae TaxID=2509459 RepID=A0A4P6EPL1_9MICO|nr:zinc finger domain-containing protein [Xylanimonas allomyrinae]QAY62197.1 Fpg/Nei family DNA glycosylase [Xylanimonas allomyrinae]
MPEGHTVHRLARMLAELFGGQALAVTSPQGRFAAGAALVSGRVLVASEAWGKQLFLGFGPVPGGGAAVAARPPEGPDREGGAPHDGAADLWLRVHLGLYGAWTFATDGTAAVVHAIGAPRRRVGDRESAPEPPASPTRPCEPGSAAWAVPEPRGAVRARLLGAHAVADLTGPSACEVVTAEQKAAVEAQLGPDPLRPDGGRGSLAAARAAFVDAVRGSRVAVGQQLLSQGVVAGVGNIYRAEALFRARLDPLRPGRDVDAGTLGALWDDLVGLMHDGAATGAIVTTRPQDRTVMAPDPGRRRTRQNTDGTPGAVPADAAFYVYHRDGLPCRLCRTPVLTRQVAGRTLYWCGTCQR